MIFDLIRTALLSFFILNCARPFPSTHVEESFPFVVVSGLWNASNASDHSEYYIIFVTGPQSSGGFGSVANADVICNTDSLRPNIPANGTYHALLVDDSGTRVASVDPDVGNGQLNWVLKANREYRQANSQKIIGITNNVGLFPFNLKNPWSDQFSGDFFWSGLNTDWTTQTGSTCGNWTGFGNGSTGDLGALTTASIASSINGCNAPVIRLVCVQQ